MTLEEAIDALNEAKEGVEGALAALHHQQTAYEVALAQLRSFVVGTPENMQAQKKNGAGRPRSTDTKELVLAALESASNALTMSTIADDIRRPKSSVQFSLGVLVEEGKVVKNEDKTYKVVRQQREADIEAPLAGGDPGDGRLTMRDAIMKHFGVR